PSIVPSSVSRYLNSRSPASCTPDVFHSPLSAKLWPGASVMSPVGLSSDTRPALGAASCHPAIAWSARLAQLVCRELDADAMVYESSVIVQFELFLTVASPLAGSMVSCNFWPGSTAIEKSSRICPALFWPREM